MKQHSHQLLLTKNDYSIMMTFLRAGFLNNSLDRANAEKLEGELKRARLVESEHLPGDVVRLNSKVRIQKDKGGQIMEFTLVAPGKADIREKRISVLAPMGTALIGFRKGQKVNWQVPSGKVCFTILDVTQPSDR